MKLETPHLTVVCEKTGVEVFITRTDEGKGRINSIRVYDTSKKLQVVTNIYLNGNEIETRQINHNKRNI